MEHWQFLIQRQGDRSWHTLESSNVELLEGRYRVLARSNRPNTDVEVRLIHSSTQEVPPKRRVQKRSRRTNSEGLMAVVPYTYFKAGSWELQCSGDLMSDILGKSWQYSVYLQVLSQSVDGVVERLDDGERGESNSPNNLDTAAVVELPTPVEQAIATTTEPIITTDPPPKTTEDVSIDQPVSPVWLKGETAEQILHNLIELALPSSEPVLEDETLEDASATPASPLLILTLDREIYVAHWGEALTITGQVALKEKVNSEDNTPYPKNLYALELGIELRSPLGSEILTQIRQPLADEVLPFTITYSVDIPAECESKLILADVSLHGALTDIGEVMVLASQSFTITADVTELLTITAAKSSPENQLNDEIAVTALAVREPETSARLDLALFNLVKSNKTNHSLVFTPSVNKSLPPRVESRSLNKSTTSRELQLPNFPVMPTQAIALQDSILLGEDMGGAIATVVTEAPQPEDIINKDETIAPINLGELLIRNRPVPISKNLPYLKRLKALPSGQDEVNNNVTDLPEILDSENSKPLDITRNQDETTPELAVGDQPIVEVAGQSAELIDQPVADVAIPADSQLIIEGNPYSSPLITKWLQSQGYILPEPEQNDTYIPPRQIISRNQVPLPSPPPLPPVNLNLPLLDVETAISADEEAVTPENIEISENTEIVKPEETEILTDLHVENEVKEVTAIRRLPPPPPPHPFKKQPAWLSQEIVVDDTVEPEVEAIASSTLEQEEEPESDVSPTEAMTAVLSEPLPIPQLHVPEGELIAGSSIKIYVELPDLPPEIAVKLWVEDYQTRWLFDGPHLLKNLQPSPAGGLEVMTQLDVPFGCLEIRLEAIALNLVTQQESHKVTIVRTVIPPDLPSLQLDELLGML
ncbi:hypothetical protein [Calothrix sp. PCC 7507]|uniref:hypothetical protein n=1 Tax=Calothrix sp. PCC 7507 TaxID=99598 RepID=UPI00029ECF7E|nr:hypothetical protein [Calothrix sp. PCC 7507]AFY32150.1 hypothetical protein Cal7507_1693 [Calothrix sp. PCC 7507]